MEVLKALLFKVHWKNVNVTDQQSKCRKEYYNLKGINAQRS